MMYKATLTFSLLFLAVVGSAQNDGGADSSDQPPSNFSSSTASQVYPSGIPIPTTPSDGNSSQTNRTRPSGCHPHSAMPTDHPLSTGVFSSAVYSASPGVSKPHFNCEPDTESTMIPTGTASVPAYSGGALPSTDVSGPIQTMPPNGTHHGNFTLPTGSPEYPSSIPGGQQDPPVSSPTATVSYGKLDCSLNNHFYSDWFTICFSRQKKACPPSILSQRAFGVSDSSLSLRAMPIGKNRR